MKVIYEKDMRVPIKIWANYDALDKTCIEQITNTSKLPFVFKHVCLMPDGHGGYGMPIGGVIACDKVVIPNAVGVDIGCGMCAVKTSLKLSDVGSYLNTIVRKIKKVIPVGFEHHKEHQNETLMPSVSEYDMEKIVSEQYQSATHQLGTLGGGNHFIEIQKDEEDCIWIMVHSGSRNLGYKVAQHYNNVAKKLNEKWHVSVPSKYDLAFLPRDSEEGQMYLQEMNYCLGFALSNRRLMMDRIIDSFHTVLNSSKTIAYSTDMINIHHNYAQMEHHFGKNVMVHRKGATNAKKGQLGIIPGSQGTASYIVKGLGNPESFESCSHGAGRAMGRKDAKRRLNLADEMKTLNDQGIIHSVSCIDNLDEAPSAYKDIEDVMERQKDLVEIVVKLKPLAVIKG